MMDLSYRSWRVWQRNLDVFLKLWRSEVPGFLIEPVIILLAMGVGLGTYVFLGEGQEYFAFIAPGIVASYAMFSASFECTYGSFVRMSHQKTYDAIISTPLSIDDVSAGEILWGASRALLTGTAVLVIASAFGLVHSFWALLVLPLTLLSGIMFSSIALFFTAVVPAIYSFNYYYTLFITPMFFVSGVFFPLTGLPEVAQHLAWIAPLTPVANLTRALMSGRPGDGSWWGLGIIVGYTVVFMLLALVMMKRRLLK